MGNQIYDKIGQRKYLNKAESKLFLAEASKLEGQEKALCLFLYYTGCRISEALEMTPQRVEFENDLAIIRCLKKRASIEYRAVLIPEKLVSQLSLITATHEARFWSFSRTTAWRIVKKVMSQVGVTGSKATAQSLRHTFAVRAILNGAPLNKIQSWLGHSDLSVTSIYLNVTGEEDRQFIKKTW